MEETQHVFIAGNDLVERFAKAKQFVIGETGFGSGLNFIATVDTWRKTASAEARLHYISVEKHPFTKQDLSTALSVWPTLGVITSELLAVYPPAVHGVHYRQLFNGQISLSLLFGDAGEMLSELNAQVDAWFLDGFAPTKNQSLWSDALFASIAAHTATDGSFATYTAAGDVRRRLQAAGFLVTKRPGFGKKREMLTGRLTSKPPSILSRPWFYQPPVVMPESRHAIVIGAGIAGVTTATALAQRGWHITLIEQQSSIANGASGNPAGVVLPRLTADMSLEARFYLTAYLHATNWLQQLQTQGLKIGWHNTGVVQLLDTTKQQALGKLGLPESIVTLLDEAGISAAIGVAATQRGVLYSRAGWLEPRRCCQALLQSRHQIKLLTSTNIHHLERTATTWQVHTDSGVAAAASVVVIASGSEVSRLLPRYANWLQAVRGQLSYSQAQDTPLKRPVCYDGYIIPLTDRRYCIGASYDRDSHELALRDQDQQDNLNALHQALPAVDCAPPDGGRVAWRAASIDHLPIVGPVAEENFYRQHYADLQHGRPAQRYPLAEYETGLYINSGHGSRGLTSCPLAAEILACMINAEPLPVLEDIRLALHPARFLVRDLKRQAPGE